MRTALLCLALLLATPLVAGRSSVSALPIGKVKVDVMTAVTAPRAAELSAKLRAAVQNDREQWLADVKEVQSDERLAWNERLGLTRKEQDELQRLGSEVTFVKTAEAEIEFVRSQDGRVTLVPDSSLPQLAGVVLDVNHDVVDTPFGRTTERSDVDQPQSWYGTEWKLEVPGEEPSTGTLVKFSIGQLANDGRIILSFDAKQVENDQMPRRANCVIVLRDR